MNKTNQFKIPKHFYFHTQRTLAGGKNENKSKSFHQDEKGYQFVSSQAPSEGNQAREQSKRIGCALLQGKAYIKGSESDSPSVGPVAEAKRISPDMSERVADPWIESTNLAPAATPTVRNKFLTVLGNPKIIYPSIGYPTGKPCQPTTLFLGDKQTVLNYALNQGDHLDISMLSNRRLAVIIGYIFEACDL